MGLGFAEGGEVVGDDEAADDEEAAETAEEGDGFVKPDGAGYHGDKGLGVEIVVGGHGAYCLHGFVPDDVGRYGTYYDEKEEVEHEFGLGEVEDESEVARFLLEQKQWK